MDGWAEESGTREHLDRSDREWGRGGFYHIFIAGRFPHAIYYIHSTYRDEINSLQIQLSRTQAGPDRAVKKQQEQNSPNHVQRINLISVQCPGDVTVTDMDSTIG